MADSGRVGEPNSGEVIVTAGDGNTPQTVLDVNDDRLFEANQLILEYDPAATVTIELTLHDDDDGTAAGNLSTALKTIKNLSPGDVRDYTDLSLRDFENDVLIQTDGNQDDEVAVYVDGKEITEALVGPNG